MRLFFTISTHNMFFRFSLYIYTHIHALSTTSSLSVLSQQTVKPLADSLSWLRISYLHPALLHNINYTPPTATQALCCKLLTASLICSTCHIVLLLLAFPTPRVTCHLHPSCPDLHVLLHIAAMPFSLSLSLLFIWNMRDTMLFCCCCSRAISSDMGNWEIYWPHVSCGWRQTNVEVEEANNQLFSLDLKFEDSQHNCMEILHCNLRMKLFAMAFKLWKFAHCNLSSQPPRNNTWLLWLWTLPWTWSTDWNNGLTHVNECEMVWDS